MIQQLEETLERFSDSRAEDAEAIEALVETMEGLSKEKAPSVKSHKKKKYTFTRIKEKEFSISHGVRVNNPVETWNYDREFIYIKPWSLKGTVNAVKHMEAANNGMKGIGSRHSYSNVVEADNCYIDLSDAHPYEGNNAKKHNQTIKKFDQRAVKRLKKEVLANGRREYYFDVPSGLTIGELNQVLGPDKSGRRPYFGSGKAKRLFNMGGGDVQAFAGAFSTGTHGTGGKHTAYHDMIRSILLVAEGGKLYRIEPQGEGAITDPEKHARFYDNKPAAEKVELLQDDDAFYSTLVSMGCFGIIYSTIIEVKDMTRLHEEVIYLEGGWNAREKKRINAGILPSDPEQEYFYSIQLNPYRVGKSRNPSMISKIVVPTDRKPTSKRQKARNFWPSHLAGSSLAASIVREIATANTLPKRRLIESALKAQNDHSRSKGDGYNDVAYRVWSAGDGKLATIGTGIEFAFPVDEVVDAVDAVMVFMEKQAKEKTGLFLNAPMALRFVRPSKALLAPNYHRYKNKEVDLWCYIEILRINSANDPEEDKRELKLYAELQKLLHKIGGRPHWGLNFNFPFTQAKLKKLYPKLEVWRNTLDRFNSNGSFDNSFLRKAGFRPIP